MGSTPYRAAPRAPAPEEPDPATHLGSLRSTHVPVPLLHALFPAFGMLGLALVGAAFVAGHDPFVLAFVLPLAAVIALLAGWSPYRTRHLRVELYMSGLCIENAGEKKVLLFEDVTEVWYTLDSVRSPWGRVAPITTLRLVDHAGGRYILPARLQGSLELIQTVMLRCSSRLVPEALSALRAGETLTFGDLTVDQAGIRGASWAMSWKDVRLVRLSPGKVALLRSPFPFFAKTIQLDRIPHPTVFIKAVSACARKIDVDDPVAKLFQ